MFSSSNCYELNISLLSGGASTPLGVLSCFCTEFVSLFCKLFPCKKCSVCAAPNPSCSVGRSSTPLLKCWWSSPRPRMQRLGMAPPQLSSWLVRILRLVFNIIAVLFNIIAVLFNIIAEQRSGMMVEGLGRRFLPSGLEFFSAFPSKCYTDSNVRKNIHWSTFKLEIYF